MRRRSVLPAALAVAFAGAGCSDLDITEIPMDDISPAYAVEEVCETIDFNDFAHGNAVNSVTLFAANITVTTDGYPPESQDQAYAFETDGEADGGVVEDTDMQWRGEAWPGDAGSSPAAAALCPNCEGLGRVLVIGDSRGFTPYGDSRWGGTITFSGFSGGPFTVKTFTAVDDDEAEPDIDLYLDNVFAAGSNSVGNGSVEVVAVNQTFSNTMRFELGTAVDDDITGSGAVDNIEICKTIINGDEGCTPGYWKNHTDSWAATGFSPGQTLESVFDVPNALGMDNNTLLEALSFGGGPGVEGAARILLRAAVAGLLNASHPDVEYTKTSAEIIAEVNAALASGNRSTMLTLASEIDTDNNLGCPIN